MSLPASHRFSQFCQNAQKKNLSTTAIDRTLNCPPLRGAESHNLAIKFGEKSFLEGREGNIRWSSLCPILISGDFRLVVQLILVVVGLRINWTTSPPKFRILPRLDDDVKEIKRRTVGETNLYDKKFLPRGLTAFSGHTRSGLHGNYQISPLWGCCHTNRFWKTAILLWKWKAFSSFSVFSLMEFFDLDVDICGIKRCGIWWRIREMD